ncbi:MAG: MFS transporter, partial [Sulfurimonas sp.]|nr:MFS transporter [Sulfurimonas sp.]
ALAPADKRPVYIALQINVISFGLFFSIIGGVILHFFSYEVLYSTATAMLFLSLYFSFKLKD